jgi:hypothetical protein
MRIPARSPRTAKADVSICINAVDCETALQHTLGWNVLLCMQYLGHVNIRVAIARSSRSMDFVLTWCAAAIRLHLLQVHVVDDADVQLATEHRIMNSVAAASAADASTVLLLLDAAHFLTNGMLEHLLESAWALHPKDDGLVAVHFDDDHFESEDAFAVVSWLYMGIGGCDETFPIDFRVDIMERVRACGTVETCRLADALPRSMDLEVSQERYRECHAMHAEAQRGGSVIRNRPAQASEYRHDNGFIRLTRISLQDPQPGEEFVAFPEEPDFGDDSAVSLFDLARAFTARAESLVAIALARRALDSPTVAATSVTEYLTTIAPGAGKTAGKTAVTAGKTAVVAKGAGETAGKTAVVAKGAGETAGKTAVVAKAAGVTGGTDVAAKAAPPSLRKAAGMTVAVGKAAGNTAVATASVSCAGGSASSRSTLRPASLVPLVSQRNAGACQHFVHAVMHNTCAV